MYSLLTNNRQNETCKPNWRDKGSQMSIFFKTSITVAKMKNLLLDNIGFFLSSRHVYIDDDAILRTYSWLTNVTVSVLTWPTLTLTF